MNWFNDLLLQDFSSFIGKSLQASDPGSTFMPNWHIDLIAEYLEAARRGDITRLIINMPPRALKSQCVSIAWPAWILGHDPASRIMAASYSQRLSLKHSLDCRQVIHSSWYQRLFPHTRLSREQNEKHKFATTRGGFRLATSLGGTATGEGGNVLIIDDPLSAAQATNPLWREQAKRWYDQTFSTRLNDKKKGVIVLVMQRLHADDLTAHLLAKGGFTTLSLPAIATEDTTYDIGPICYSRKRGELLHPEREDAAALARAERELGSQAFSAQYQQLPLPEQGSMLKRDWLKRHDTLPAFERIVQSWDTAIKAQSHHDASACLTFGQSQGMSYLLDAQVMRLEYPDLKRACLSLAHQFKPHAILIEDKASGQQLLQDLQRETSLPLLAVSSHNNKVTRFAGISAMIEAGRLSLPQHAPWLAAFESELLHFPHAKHDDQVDALMHYLDFCRKNNFDKLTIRRL